MRRVLAAVVLALVALTIVTEAAAGSSIYADIYAATGIHRTVDASLEALAKARAVEIVTDFSHDGWPGTTYEVIAWNAGYADPVAEAVNQWMGSPDHRAILTDPTLNAIGCGSAYSGGRTYFACELIHSAGATPTATPLPTASPGSSAGQPQVRPQPTNTPTLLPNTSYAR